MINLHVNLNAGKKISSSLPRTTIVKYIDRTELWWVNKSYEDFELFICATYLQKLR